MTGADAFRRIACSVAAGLGWALLFVVLDLLVGGGFYEWFFATASARPVWLVPLWMALPAACVSLLVGMAARLLRRRFDAVALLLCCVAVTVYYLWRRYGGGLYVNASLLAYAIAFLPPACVPAGFAAGYLLAGRKQRRD